MRYFIFILLTICSFTSHGQSHEEIEGTELKNHLSIEVGVTFIPEGRQIGMTDEEFIAAPTIGLEYKREFDSKWSAALITDVEMKKYEIETETNQVVRENIFIISAVAMYNITHRFAVYTGPGYEIEKHQNYWLLRAGLKYEFDLGNEFDLSPTFEFDVKEEYTSFFLGFGVGKKF